MEQKLQKSSQSLNLSHECTPCNVVITERGYDYSGCHFINNDHLGLDEKKDVVLVKAQPTDIIELQNSYKDECDIKNIIKKSAMLGVSLEAGEGEYGDSTLVSDSMNERNAQAIANAQAIESNYKKLPKEVTGGLSVAEFIKALGSSDVVDYVKSKMKEENTNEK